MLLLFKDVSVREAPPTRTTDSERKSVFKSCGSQSSPKGKASRLRQETRQRTLDSPQRTGSPIQLLERLRPKRSYAVGFTTLAPSSDRVASRREVEMLSTSAQCPTPNLSPHNQPGQYFLRQNQS
ncbi:hypothetical protein [Nostoc sp.]|uniref:hypothetical protein n=1 Tax=Nostoc sp. TaxID=1180 RepID=UPI002FF64E71